MVANPNKLLDIIKTRILTGRYNYQDDGSPKSIATYKDYLESIPEAKELLSNLYQVQSQIEEKEYELEQLKKEQQKNLEKNNQKVKTLDNRRVA